MMRKKRWALVILMLTFFAGCFFSDGQHEARADQDVPVEDITPYKKPTGDVKKFLGIWMTSGYNLQPNPYNYTVVGSPVTLYTDQARSMATAILTFSSWAHYQWYSSPDGSKWTKMKGATSKNLTVTPTQVGTMYYQQETSWYMFISALSPTVYSKVASVNTLSDHVDATAIKVTTDDDYLYYSSPDTSDNSQITTTSTYAHAEITPSNFTGQLTWSVDKPELATIDPNSGLITSNMGNRSGEVTVTATATNSDGSTIVGQTTILVGGGLEDQTVDAGDTATFTLMGNIGEFDTEEGLDYTIRWFKEDPITHAQSEIDIGQNNTSHTTPPTTLNDDGTLFWAVITVNGKTSTGGTKQYEYETNEAMLHVRPIGGLDLEMDDTLDNETYNDGSNSSTILYDVNYGDNVIYHSAITNNSSGGQLNNATYTLPLRKGSTINDVLVDGSPISDDEYNASVDSDTGEITLTISNINLDINQSKQIDVDTNVGPVTSRETYRSTAYLKGTDSSGNTVQKVGDTRYMNLTTGLMAVSVQNIDYGSILPIGNNPIILRQNDVSSSPNNIMTVDDMRRNKPATEISIVQDGQFTNNITQEALQGHLKFIDTNENEFDLLSTPKVIATTNTGQSMNSISWRADQGVVLAMDNKMNSSGSYQTTLDWQVTESV